MNLCSSPITYSPVLSDYAIVESHFGRIVIPSKSIKNRSESLAHGGLFQDSTFPPTPRTCRHDAAMEESKLVYILNRDAAANLTISSPLEAHGTSSIVHHIVGIDVGFENPMFAALEVD